MRKRTSWILVFLLGLVAFTANATNAEEALSIIPESSYKIGRYDIVFGKEDAPIQVLEYYSLTCSHCSYFYLKIFPSLKKEYIDTGLVRWIKRSLVMAGDMQAMKATLLLGCVRPEAEGSYLKILLSKQSSWAYHKDFLPTLENMASLGGMSHKTFKECMSHVENERIVREISLKASNEAKINSTPTFYVNQNKIIVFSEQSFKDEFKKILADKK